MKTQTKQMIAGLIIVNTLLVGGRYGCNYIDESRDATESRGYAVPERFKVKSMDLNNDGKSETIANYNGRAYLFRVDTNGVPYFVPIKGLETEVEK